MTLRPKSTTYKLLSDITPVWGGFSNLCKLDVAICNSNIELKSAGKSQTDFKASLWNHTFMTCKKRTILKTTWSNTEYRNSIGYVWKSQSEARSDYCETSKNEPSTWMGSWTRKTSGKLLHLTKLVQGSLCLEWCKLIYVC